MAVSKVGDLIKEARTNAGLSQDRLAKMIDGLSATDISKAERGEKELTQSQLKAIAKATGVTQKSLLEAAAAQSEAKKPAEKKNSSSADGAIKLTTAEKNLLELYRKADSDTKKKAISVLKGEAADGGDIISSLIGSALNSVLNGKK